MSRTKIVCTIGPSSRDPAVLREIFLAGMQVARLNFSHGDQEYHGENIRMIRELSDQLDQPVAIMVDLQGPKLRVGNMSPDGVNVTDGENVILTNRPIIGHSKIPNVVLAEIPLQYVGLPKEVGKGDRILIDDGLIELNVLDSTESEIHCRVVTGGAITSNKGLNLPNVALSTPAVTEKDWADLEFALSVGADWIALSFVRSAKDVRTLKDGIKALTKNNHPLSIIAKIEKSEALDEIDDIIREADGIMVARGDLGIEIEPEKVPLVQKMIIRRCNAAGIPVITATQMLDSMIRNPRPTRAEASDVANAILDGTDAVMLSGETAAGKYPIESVRTMASIAKVVEVEQHEKWVLPSFIDQPIQSITEALSHATCETAHDLGASAIITATASGRTAMAVARYRPVCPIIAVTPSRWVQQKLMLVHGVIPVLGIRTTNTDEMLDGAIAAGLKSRLISRGDLVVITAGISPNTPGSTDLMKVEKL